ncbi:MAG TPA: ATP-binding cassette domain-containing protein [Acidimicrobiales bacterium]|jgi:ABC-2 type transport system ATP-binding protein|nr:ATP-binding cassette domain-containing protein [Acidimicrobiales bacterium]
MGTSFAIDAEQLRKRYGASEALAGVDLAVATGSVCALLGPNGAGKTTAVRILTTLSRPTGGRARVAGFDVVAQPLEVRRRIGLAAQDATVDGLLTGLENLTMIGELHHLGRANSRRRGQQLLEQFSLADTGQKLVKDYSGGMRRRLDLAATLVGGPEVLFLDEPTTGLDPRGRNELWAVLDTLVDGGTTILLTTQYLEEAERLANEIVVVDHGRVIARGDARSLKRHVGGDQLLIVPVDPADLERTAAVVERVVGVRATIDPGTRQVTAPAESGVAAIASVATELVAAGIAVEDLGIHQPTLDDVFLTLTGTPPEQPVSEIEEALR